MTKKKAARKKTARKKTATRVSLRSAIDAFCTECIFDPDQPELGKWRQQIDLCTSTKCPLYGVRAKAYTPKAVK